MFKLHIGCSTYKHGLLLEQHILSFLNQTRKDDVCITYLHDGYDAKTEMIIESWQDQFEEGQLNLYMSPERTNQYGHNLRRKHLHETTEEFWKTDNADNYMVPRALELMLAELEDKNLDFLYTNVLHNYADVNGDGQPVYNNLISHPHLNRINACNWIARTSLAKATDWTDYSTGGDGIFVQQLVTWNPGIRVGKLNSSLFVHN